MQPAACMRQTGAVLILYKLHSTVNSLLRNLLVIVASSSSKTPMDKRKLRMEETILQFKQT